MGKQQRKFEKKKARDRAVKAKLRIRREAKSRKDKEIRQDAKELDSYNKVVKERIQLEQWAKMAEGKIPDDLQEKIQHNIQILKSLEEAHAAELKAQQEARELASQQEKQLMLTPESELVPENQ